MDHNALNEPDLHALFDRLFPNGFGGDDVREEIAPEGWCSSPLRACRRRDVAQPAAVHDKPSDDAKQEMCELVAACLWDIFSDNHDVIMRDGRQADIGSFRGAAGFLADRLNTQMGAQRYDYMDFYMGTIWLRDRADLPPVYRMIFHRCQREGCDWHYRFPRLGLVDLRPVGDALNEGGEAEWKTYAPSKSFEQECRRKEADAALNAMRETFDEWHRQNIETARRGQPPPTVQAYQAVYARDPPGWPP